MGLILLLLGIASAQQVPFGILQYCTHHGIYLCVWSLSTDSFRCQFVVASECVGFFQCANAQCVNVRYILQSTHRSCINKACISLYLFVFVIIFNFAISKLFCRFVFATW